MTLPHHFWTHFVCGVVFGAGLGVWLGWCFSRGWELATIAAVVAVSIACTCGRWGDRAWHWIIERFPWLT